MTNFRECWAERPNACVTIRHGGFLIMTDVMLRYFFPTPTPIPVSERLAQCRVLLSEDKNSAEALSMIREIIKDNPQHIGALIFFSKMCALEGTREARINLNKLLKLRPFLKKTLLKRIHSYRHNYYENSYDNIELVLNDFETLLSLKTDHVETLKLRYNYFRELGRTDEALRDLNTLIRIAPDPDRIQYIADRMNSYDKQSNLDAKQRDLDTLIQIAPDPTSYLIERWQLRRKNLNYDGAISDLSHLIRIQPDNMEHVESRMRLYMKQGYLDAQLNALNTLIEHRPSHLNYLLLRHQIFKAKQDLDLELADIKTILTIKPGHQSTLFRLSEIHRENNDRAAELDTLSKFIHFENNTGETNSTNYKMALSRRSIIYYQLDQIDESLLDLNELLNLYPTLIEPLTLRQKILLSEGNCSGAIQDEYKIYKLSLLNKQTIPSLQSMCKWSFLKQESSICAMGQVFRHNPDKLRSVFSNSGITPITLATMRKKFNGNEDIPVKTVFDQLDSMDIERVFGGNGMTLKS